MIFKLHVGFLCFDIRKIFKTPTRVCIRNFFPEVRATKHRTRNTSTNKVLILNKIIKTRDQHRFSKHTQFVVRE